MNDSTSKLETREPYARCRATVLPRTGIPQGAGLQPSTVLLGPSDTVQVSAAPSATIWSDLVPCGNSDFDYLIFCLFKFCSVADCFDYFSDSVVFRWFSLFLIPLDFQLSFFLRSDCGISVLRFSSSFSHFFTYCSSYLYISLGF